jgi:hypothetical protein
MKKHMKYVNSNGASPGCQEIIIRGPVLHDVRAVTSFEAGAKGIQRGTLGFAALAFSQYI